MKFSQRPILLFSRRWLTLEGHLAFLATQIPCAAPLYSDCPERDWAVVDIVLTREYGGFHVFFLLATPCELIPSLPCATNEPLHPRTGQHNVMTRRI
jgi:hypothetical protein